MAQVQILDCPPPEAVTLDYAAIKSKQQATWASGDFAKIGTTLQIVGESLCVAVDLHAGQRVLDVAAGNGNAALAAARCGCDVVASDYVPALLDAAQRRADADGLALRTVVADSEELPFEPEEFDAVVSTFGVMFSPNQEQGARELVRVCRPGGKIGLANWTPTGFIGELLKVVSGFVPPPPGLRAPSAWGTTHRLEELFGRAASRIHAVPRTFVFRYLSADHFVDFFRKYYGPTHRAFAALDPDRQQKLASAIAALAERFNTAHDGTLAASAEYLEVVIDRR